MGGGDVVEDQLVRPLRVVAGGELHRVAGVPVGGELDPRTTRPRATSRQGMMRLVSMTGSRLRRRRGGGGEGLGEGDPPGVEGAADDGPFQGDRCQAGHLGGGGDAPEAITAAGTAPARAASSSKLGSVRVLSRVMSVQMKRSAPWATSSRARSTVRRPEGPSSPGGDHAPRRPGPPPRPRRPGPTPAPPPGRVARRRPQHHPAGPRLEGGLRASRDSAPQLQARRRRRRRRCAAPRPGWPGPRPGSRPGPRSGSSAPRPARRRATPPLCPGRPSPWRSPLAGGRPPGPL